MLVSKSDPQIILVIEVYSTVVCSLDFSILSNVLLVVSDRLIIEIVNNWSNYIKAAVQKEKRGSWFPWSDLFVSLVELLEVFVQLLSKAFSNLAAAQVLNVGELIVNSAYC